MSDSEKCKACGRSKKLHKHSKKKNHQWQRIACDPLTYHLGAVTAAVARGEGPGK